MISHLLKYLIAYIIYKLINAKSTDKVLETVKETIASFLLIAKAIFQKVGLRNFFFQLQNNTK
ncbi:hypothetical protein FLA4_00410 [Candidatus Rickettsia kotlanii]|nr:hypothetical protein FLA4_00410 [Candidatus Rickettsia kotlanii]BDU60873.1 hypothetical protein HM2_00410 [Candidatus Rickettsia kotlanii]